jgi:hypothetical protein
MKIAQKIDEKIVSLSFTPSHNLVNLQILILRALHYIWYYLARLNECYMKHVLGLKASPLSKDTTMNELNSLIVFVGLLIILRVVQGWPPPSKRR